MGPLNGVVFAVVRRIVREPDEHSMVVCEIQGSFDELRASAAVFGTIVEVEHQYRRVGAWLPIPASTPLCDPIYSRLLLSTPQRRYKDHRIAVTEC